LSEVSVVFDLSASASLMAASVPILLSSLNENEMKQQITLPERFSEVRDVFDLSASDNSTTPSVPILFPVLSEHEMKQQGNYS
jgi:hypothetical protein